MPSAFARTITVARIEIAGATVKRALDTIVVLSVSLGMPSSLAFFNDLTIKNIDYNIYLIKTNKFITINDIINKYSICERSFRRYIAEINAYLSNNFKILFFASFSSLMFF